MNFRDFGAGLSVDELIGLTAYHIQHLSLPSGEIFAKAKKAARRMVDANLESYLLVELWEDGHSVWVDPTSGDPVVVSQTGQMNRTRSE